MNQPRLPLPQRLRLTYRQDQAMRFISHLDLIRVFERALRRAGLPLAYTQGFNARPRITSAAPLPVGFAGEAEVVDILLSQPLSLEEFRKRLLGQLPRGLGIRHLQEVPRKLPPLPATLRAAEFRVRLPEVHDAVAAREAVAQLLATPEIRRPRRGKRRGGNGDYDLRGLILRLVVSETGNGVELHMTLKAEPGATGRPEEALAALGYPGPAEITRLRLITSDPANADG